MRNGFTVFLVLLSVTLAGCGTPKLREGPPPPPTEVTPGSTFKLMKGFIVPSGDSSVFFQAGELYPDGNIQPNLPYCEFSVGAANADGVLLREGTFTVSEVTYDERDAGPGVDISVTGIHLQDALTGKTYQMDCMLPLLSTGALYVTPAEVQGAVADYMELKLAP